MKNDGRRVLVTGGAGFIGSHLCEHLLSRGHTVEVIDDLSTGRLENLAAARDNPRFRLHVDTVLNPNLLAPLVDRCDAIVHLAAAVGVQLIVRDPVGTIETNVRGTEAILEQAEKGKKRVLLASTSEVYGKSTKIPFSEEDDLVLGPTHRARWSYACSKAIDEFLGQAYWTEKGVPVTIVRLFNTVGPRQLGRYGMVVPNFVRQALHGLSLTVFGSGKQSRCFCHVQDVVGALATLLLVSETTGEVYNVGSSQEVSILELARRVIDITGSSSDIVIVPYEEAYAPGFEDMPRRVPDLRKISAAIGFSPRFDLDQIIRSVVEYERERQSTAPPADNDLEGLEQDEKVQ